MTNPRPTGSSYCLLTPVMELVKTIEPKSVLDIGIGFGKWGFLCRAYLDARRGQFNQEEWRTWIGGVELCEENLTPLQRVLYNQIWRGDVADLVDDLPEVEMVLAIGVMEYIEKARALATLEKLAAKTKWLLLCLPVGERWAATVVSEWDGNEIIRRFKVHLRMAADLPIVVPVKPGQTSGRIELFLIKGARYGDFRTGGEAGGAGSGAPG